MLQIWAPDGVGEIRAGDDLTDLIVAAIAGDGRALADGDIVVITSKAVSKAEGCAQVGTRDDVLPSQTLRVVARRGPTRIVRNLLGLTLAAAGIDASNVEAGTVLVLPVDPDASAEVVRRELLRRLGVRVGVIITDTAGRAWREGQTDIAIGAAGVTVLESFAGRFDGYGNPLVVTAPAVADEIASAAELAQGKLGGRPFAVLRGRADLVLGSEDRATESGARQLIRPEGADLFGYGAREAVVRALKADPSDRLPFGAPAPLDDVLEALAEVGITARSGTLGPQDAPDALSQVILPEGTDLALVGPLFFAFGWKVDGFTGTCPHASPQTP